MPNSPNFASLVQDLLHQSFLLGIDSIRVRVHFRTRNGKSGAIIFCSSDHSSGMKYLFGWGCLDEELPPLIAVCLLFP